MANVFAKKFKVKDLNHLYQCVDKILRCCYTSLRTTWKGYISNSLSHDSRNHRLTHFTDCSLRYTTRQMEIEWCCNNLFNKSQIDNIYLDNLTEQCIESSLRPQEFLMKIRFAF